MKRLGNVKAPEVRVLLGLVLMVERLGDHREYDALFGYQASSCIAAGAVPFPLPPCDSPPA